MTTLALDLGTCFGYAFSDGRSGSYNTKADVQRFLRFWRWLEANALTCDAIAYEDVKRHIGTRAAHVYGGFKAILEAFASQHGIALQPVSIQTIKRHATGRGNAQKADMMAAATARGWPVLDDNHADALWLLDYVSSVGEKSPSRNTTKAPKRSDDRTRSKRR